MPGGHIERLSNQVGRLRTSWDIAAGAWSGMTSVSRGFRFGDVVVAALGWFENIGK